MALTIFFELLLSLNLLTSFKAGEGLVVKKAKSASYLDLSKYSDLKLRPEINQVKRSSKRSGCPTEFKTWFVKYGEEYGVNEQLLERIAGCESTFNPQAVNGPYAGLYQFLTSTWVSNRKAMGLNSNPALRFNPEEAIKTTAYKISRDGTGAWPVCGK